MVLYHRNRVPGGTYFFTVTLADRRSRILTERIDDLRAAFRAVRRERPFQIEAIVVMPDHLHTIWTLPENDIDYPARWRAIKSQSTRRIRTQGLPLQANPKGEYALWQRRYWEHTIRDENDLQRHVDYIHFNPVKHGLVSRVTDWPYSSFHRYMRRGWLSRDWATPSQIDDGCNYGE
jgi:putative transposase